MLILKIAAGVIIGLLVGAVALLVLARALLKRLAGNLAQALSDADVVPPVRISLDDGEPAEWSDAEWLDAQTRVLEEHAFRRAGDFTVPEMANLRMRGFVHEEEGVVAALTEHEQAGVWIDVVQLNVDGTCIAVTSSPETGLSSPPWKTSIREEGVDADVLLGKLVEARDAASSARCAPEDFAKQFESAYAREMDWMLERGGPSEAEIVEIARLGGREADESAIDMIRQLWGAQAAAHRDRQMRERFLQTTDLSAAEWTKLEDRIVFVHDRMDEDELGELISEVLDWDDEEECEGICERARARTAGTKGRTAFVLMNEALPEALRYEKLAELSGPCPADVFVMPDLDADAEGALRQAG